MVISRTSAVDVSIQAVSPELIVLLSTRVGRVRGAAVVGRGVEAEAGAADGALSLADVVAAASVTSSAGANDAWMLCCAIAGNVVKTSTSCITKRSAESEICLI